MRSFWPFHAQREAYKQGRDIDNRDTSHITCFRCDKLGHYAADCPDRLLKIQENVEKNEEDTQEADELMMHKIVYNKHKIKPSVSNINKKWRTYGISTTEPTIIRVETACSSTNLMKGSLEKFDLEATPELT